jgi:uncharacterized membrane protein YgcG
MKGIFRNSSTVFRLASAVLPAFLLFFCAIAAHSEPVDSLPKPTDYVSDYAHVLSAETVARLDRLCIQLDKSQANAQVAVVTVRSLDGDDSADYASQLETKWKMGSKGSDRGVLVLLAVDDHKRRIDVGYGLEGILNDAKLGDIGREMVPYLRANDFDSAVTLAVGQVAQVIAADAKVTLTDDAGEIPVEQPVAEVPGSAEAASVAEVLAEAAVAGALAVSAAAASAAAEPGEIGSSLSASHPSRNRPKRRSTSTSLSAGFRLRCASLRMTARVGHPHSITVKMISGFANQASQIRRPEEKSTICVEGW